MVDVCESERANNQSEWVVSDSQGVSQTTVVNDLDEYVNFSCGYATPYPFISINIKSLSSFEGKTAFVVDGIAFNFRADGSSVKIEHNCVDCMRDYNAFMSALFNGKSMTLISETGNTIAFEVSGAREAFYDDMCLDAEFYVGADQVDCKFIVDGKVVHDGKCSKIEEDTNISFYTIGAIEFFIPLHMHDNKKTATGYWNGPTGGTHAHADLGDMKLVGNCWKNDQNSICFSK